jgi:hypothetical protein
VRFLKQQQKNFKDPFTGTVYIHTYIHIYIHTSNIRSTYILTCFKIPTSTMPSPFWGTIAAHVLCILAVYIILHMYSLHKYIHTYIHTYLKICSAGILTYLKIRTYTMSGPLRSTIAAPCAVHSRCVQRPARETHRERERERERERRRRRRRGGGGGGGDL